MPPQQGRERERYLQTHAAAPGYLAVLPRGVAARIWIRLKLDGDSGRSIPDREEMTRLSGLPGF
jgi:hypothetical protein